MVKQKDGPGLWWQLLEFMGMSWPGRRHPRAATETPPVCAACGNAACKGEDGAWRCAVHAHAPVRPRS